MSKICYVKEGKIPLCEFNKIFDNSNNACFICDTHEDLKELESRLSLWKGENGITNIGYTLNLYNDLNKTDNGLLIHD